MTDRETPEERSQRFDEMTHNLWDTAEKLKATHERMQANNELLASNIWVPSEGPTNHQPPTMKIDLNNLTYSELNQLEKDLKEHKASSKDLRVYRVSFDIGFVACEHERDSLWNPESFLNFLRQYTLYDLGNQFSLPDIAGDNGGVAEVRAIELEPDQFPEVFRQQ